MIASRCTKIKKKDAVAFGVFAALLADIDLYSLSEAKV